jgi:hypothetical protein
MDDFKKRLSALEKDFLKTYDKLLIAEKIQKSRGLQRKYVRGSF